MTSPRTQQGSRPPFRRGGRRRRQCFCKENTIDYKDASSIRRFITDRGRIEPGKKSGNCAKCQRRLTLAIKRARHLALLPYAPDHLRVTGSVATVAKISEETEDEKKSAEDEKAETTEATEATTEASAEDAVKAEETTDEAEETTDEAEETTNEAEESTNEAEESTNEAEESTDEAEETTDEAEESADEAESEEPAADVSTTEPEADASTDEEDK